MIHSWFFGDDEVRFALNQMETTKKKGDGILWIGSMVLGLIAFVYLADGFYHLAIHESGAFDLRTRWIEQHYIDKGINPHDANQNPARVLPEIGPPIAISAYPPWAYLTNELLVPRISWPLARIWFAVLNLCSLLIMAAWAYRVGRSESLVAGVLLAVSVLALSSNTVSLRLGQFSIIVCAFLVFMLHFERKEMPVLAGISLGLAMTKPQMAALFTFVLLARKQWIGAGVAVLYTLIASAVIWVRVGADPLTMVQQSFSNIVAWEAFALGFWSPLISLGLTPSMATRTGMVVGGLVAFILTWRYRDVSSLALMAIASVLAQLWTYHLRYDHVMMIFLVVAVGRVALQKRNYFSWGAFIVVGLSVWAPIAKSHWTGIIPFIQYAIWIAGLAVVLWSEKQKVRPVNSYS